MTWTLCLALLLAADAAEGAKKDLEKMQGAWAPVEYVLDGNPATAEGRKAIRLRVQGDRSEFTRGTVSLHGTYKLNPARTPKELDVVLTDGPNKGQTRQGIYTFEGDRLKICLATVGKERPKEFVSRPESGVALEVWEREKQ